MTKKLPDEERTLASREIVTLAVYLLGGQRRPIDTEDVAIKANELAPGRYSWRKYPDQINIEIIRAFLSDAKKGKHGGYLIGSGNQGWMMTEAGVVFAKANLRRLRSADLPRKRLSVRDRRWLERERARILASDAFLKISEGRIEAITKQELCAFFRVDDYTTGAARKRKVTRLVNAFRDSPDIGAVVSELAKQMEKEPGNVE